MDIAALRAAGAFVPLNPEPKKVPVSWNGYNFDVWVIRLSSYDMKKAVEEAKAKHGDLTPAQVEYLVVSLFVRMGDKQEPLEFEDAMRLDEGLMQSLRAAINHVEPDPKASRPKKKSGTS
ncbi:MAG: hypothetical protein RSE94_03035 [Pseudomonas sp.]